MSSELDVMPLVIVSLISADNNTCPLEIEQNLKKLKALKTLLNDESHYYIEKIDKGVEILQKEKTNFSYD